MNREQLLEKARKKLDKFREERVVKEEQVKEEEELKEKPKEERSLVQGLFNAFNSIYTEVASPPRTQVAKEELVFLPPPSVPSFRPIYNNVLDEYTSVGIYLFI